FAPILGYGDLVQGNITINMVYYVEGLNHNLFSVGQSCDADLEVAFRKSNCFVRDLQEVLKEFLTMIQRNLQALVITVRTDKGTKFLNKTLNAFFKEEEIEHQTSTARTPEQNDVVKRRNRTLVKAARTMLSALKLLLFFWAEAIATACYTQNRSIIIPTHDKTAYHIINDRKPSIKQLHIFGCICYLTRDSKNLDKMKEKGDLCILVGYSTQSKGYRVYNKRTRLIVESIHIRFDEIKEMSETSVANDTSGLVPQRQKVSDYDNSDTFGPLYDELFNAGSNPQDTQPIMNIQPTSAPSTHTYVHAEENNDNQAEEEHLPEDEFTNPFCAPVQELAESSLHNIATAEPKNIKEAMADSAWIEAMQEELYQFDRLQVWHLVEKPFGKSIIRLKWLWKNKKDEDQTVIRNKAGLVAKGTQVFSNLSDGVENDISQWSTEGGDADHAGCIDTRKSTSRGIQFLGDKLVSWMSKKQDCTARSSVEAEYVALSARCAQ
nr:hypothetical protein [Tanacetum cinerariifolium]